jgi:glycosyltransferase involved in cell wall biosynthesis
MMRIAQVAPLIESVPPALYGGTERIVHYLTEELVAAGHSVTLYASADSQTSATLVPQGGRSMRLTGAKPEEVLAATLAMHEQVAQAAAAGEFDVVHLHTDWLAWSAMKRVAVPHLTTLHGRLDVPAFSTIFRAFPEAPIVSISNSQRLPRPHANWLGTVYHGLPLDLYLPGAGGGGYLAFLGRISPEKRLDRAIHIAVLSGLPLRIAAKIDRVDQRYFEEQIEPLLAHPLVEFVGEVGEADKATFLGDALGLLFPVDWPEPFGLVMIEALACGTPVIAFSRGSVPEVIDDGRTGFVVHTIGGAVAAVDRLNALSRDECRATFERRFTAARMAREYEDLYGSLQHKLRDDEKLWQAARFGSVVPRPLLGEGDAKRVSS